MTLLACSAFLLLSPSALAAESPPPSAKRLLVNNDGTNLFWRKDLTLEMVKRHAAECPDAVTTYLLCPNGIQKMMYPGELEELSTRGALPELVKAGEDPFGLFLSELKTRRMEVFITYRMNEVHNVDKDDPDLSQFWRDHPDWRVEPGAPLGNWMAQCLDYSHNEVQDRAVAQICDLLEKYRPDGIELDWMRFPRHLSGDAEKVWLNRGMLSDVVAAVKLKADELAGRLGRPVLVSVRIPSSMAGCHALGVDLVDWTQRKLVDFVTAAPFLASDFTMPIEEMRAAMADAKVPIYACIEHGYSGKPHTEATLHAAALGLYASGADGIYLFNFPCWRETQEAPPWSWVPQLKDPALLACNTLEFPLINDKIRVPNIDLPAPLPVTIQSGETKTLTLTLPGIASTKAGHDDGHTPPSPSGHPPRRGDLEQSPSQVVNALAPPAGGCREVAGGVCPEPFSLGKIMAARFICEPSDGIETTLNGEAPAAASVHAGENSVELKNTGTEAMTVTEARLALDLPSVPPTVFPDLPPEQCVHVSWQGSDENPGTLEKPVQTDKGVVKHFLSGNRNDSREVCIWLHAGTYSTDFLAVIARIGSDRPGFRCYVRAWHGGKVVVTGGHELVGRELEQYGKWKAFLGPEPGPWPRELFVNGKRAQRARGSFPSGTKLWGDTEHPDGVAGYLLPDESMGAWNRVEGMFLNYFNSWAHMTCAIESLQKDGDGHLIAIMAQPAFFIGLHKEGVQIGEPTSIENAMELLDEPGEYYCDGKSGTCHYVPRPEEEIATSEMIAASGRLMLNDVHDAWFEGISFTYMGGPPYAAERHMDEQANFLFGTGKIIERDGKLAILHNEYARSEAGAFMYRSKNTRFVRCSFSHFAGTGLDIQDGSHGNVVEQCSFEDISGSAIQVGDVKEQDHHPGAPDKVIRDNVIANCTIRNCGAEFEGSVGIFVGYANGTVISHNEIYDLPYSGVSVGWGWGEEDAGGGAYPIPYTYATPTPAGANRIEYNHIHHTMQKRDDGGAVYTLGNQPGTVIRGNYLHDNGPGGPGGIYLDEGSGYIEITGNTVHDCAKPMNYNNTAQDRKATCFEHDNAFGPTPGDKDFPEDTAKRAGPEKR